MRPAKRERWKKITCQTGMEREEKDMEKPVRKTMIDDDELDTGKSMINDCEDK